MSTGCFFCNALKLFSQISGRIPDIRQNSLAGYPAAGYPANSVSGATLLVYKVQTFSLRIVLPTSFVNKWILSICLSRGKRVTIKTEQFLGNKL